MAAIASARLETHSLAWTLKIFLPSLLKRIGRFAVNDDEKHDKIEISTRNFINFCLTKEYSIYML
jgi:hypothetical protein